MKSRAEELTELRKHLANDNIRQDEACTLADHDLVRWLIEQVNRVIAKTTEPAQAVCGLVEASCICVMPPKHEGPHECDCDGSWLDDGEMFWIVRMPVYEGARTERLKRASLSDGSRLP